MVNTPIQTMSSACQNRPKQKKRRLTIGWNPSVATCNSMTISQHRPMVTCSPWVPTKVKKAERKALRDGPAPMLKHVTELAHFETQKRDAQNEGDRHPKIS